ncbi:AGZA family xanthine/uracil permease-like MFS transporter [Anaerotaenia torta]|uniref:NCS2 family permease n=1 Tax=Anaerotaenia torta TaxID=433293 RepID=UPI003D226F80
MEKFFKLKQNGTNVSTEVIAGITTFFAMAYIIIVNPGILSETGIPYGAVFLATIFASVAGTLVMALFANVPYAQAPGMGLNAFFTYTVCFGLGFTWQQALAMVFICGIINIIITVTKIRKMIIKAIPASLQSAIGGGIGVFIAYIGLLNVGIIEFGAVPALADFNKPALIITIVGTVIILVLLLLKVKGAIIIGILITTIIGIPVGVTKLDFAATSGLSESFSELGTTIFAAFGKDGIQSLFADASKIPSVLMTIFAFSLSDTFDTIGTFIGTGKKSGIFDTADEKALQSGAGFKSKMDKALFADSVATSIGAVLGTSNTTTFVESAAGIEAGGRTGLASVVTAALFLVSIIFAPVVGIVPSAATAPALIAVGILMLSSFKEINWEDLEEAIPAFFAAIFMAFCYSISYGIATGFIFYVIVKLVKGKIKEISPVVWVASVLFIANFVILAFI